MELTKAAYQRRVLERQQSTISRAFALNERAAECLRRARELLNTPRSMPTRVVAEAAESNAPGEARDR